MNNYEYGFIAKCAEYSVDPETLVKVAGIGGFLGKVLGKSKALPKYLDYDVVRAAAKKSNEKTIKAKRIKDLLDQALTYKYEPKILPASEVHGGFAKAWERQKLYWRDHPLEKFLYDHPELKGHLHV